VFQWSSILPATFEHKIHTRTDIFLEKNMSNFFLLVSNYMLHGLGLLGRIEPARKARSPLGVSGNRGFYPCRMSPGMSSKAPPDGGTWPKTPDNN